MMILADLLILARTIYAEARGEGPKGWRAVAHVMINRWRSKRLRRDHSIAAACLRFRQFSAWNVGDPNRAALQEVGLDNRTFRGCMIAALRAYDEPDFTKGATHYHTKAVSPKWARGHTPCFKHGAHLFYNDVR